MGSRFSSLTANLTEVAVKSLAGLTVAMTVSGNEFDPEGPGWKKDSETPEYRIFYQDSPGGETRKVLLIGVVNTSPEACFVLVTDYEKFPEFMPFVQYTKLLETENVSPDIVKKWVFFYLNPPMVANRFYTIELWDEKHADGRPGVFRSRWSLDKSGRRRTPEDKDIKPKVKGGFKQPVETPLNDGFWLFEPLDGGTRTKVTYWVWTNPGGAIPPGIADKANAIALPKLWTAFTERLREKKLMK